MNPAHYDYDTLADLAEGLLEDDRAASVNAHLETCAECRDRSADLADVSRILAQAHVPSMPAELASRIDSAIAAESLNSTVVSLEQRRGRRHWRILSAAAAVVVVVGGGALVGSLAVQNSGGEDASTQAPAMDPPASSQKDSGGGAAEPAPSQPLRKAPQGPAAIAPSFDVTRSGTAYRSVTLGRQVNATLASSQLSGSGPPNRTLAGCVSRITGGKRPSLVDQATFDDRPATVIAAEGSTPSTLNIWVVGPDCSADTLNLLNQTTTTRN
jgi:hypothetical protein